MRFQRSSTLRLFLLAAIVFVGYRLVELWREPLTVPPARPAKPSGSGSALGKKPRLKPRPLSIVSIVKKNLFDPERGNDTGKPVEIPSVNLKTAQEFVLLGTMITPAVRQAIIRVPRSFAGGSEQSKATGGIGREGGVSLLRRVNLGESLGEFELAEIDSQKAVFVKGADRIELSLDFTRKSPATKVSPKPGRKALQQRLPAKNQPRASRRQRRR